LSRPFDKNRLSLTLYLQPEGPDVTRLLCRWMDRYYNPLYSCYGVHELIVRRKGSSLQFRRWSTARNNDTLWVCLFFKTWESKFFPPLLKLHNMLTFITEMVLFHSAFGALKSRCPLTLQVYPDDVCLGGEKRLFLGYVNRMTRNNISILHCNRTQSNLGIGKL
jgi:hypothetical protein